MKRRLEIARGFLHTPKILFLDEPTLGLDPQSRNQLWTHVRHLNETEGVTVFLTTHYMDEAERVAHRIAVIDHGRIVAQGTPQELKQQVLSHYQALRQLGAAKEIAEPDDKDPQLSFQLAPAIPDLNFLSTLLRQRSETGRLRELNNFLGQYIPRQRAIERLRALAPTNGYGGKHVEI